MERHPERESMIALYLKELLGGAEVKILVDHPNLEIVFCPVSTEGGPLPWQPHSKQGGRHEGERRRRVAEGILRHLTHGRREWDGGGRMSSLVAIARKELRTYFLAPVALIFPDLCDIGRPRAPRHRRGGRAAARREAPAAL